MDMALQIDQMSPAQQETAEQQAARAACEALLEHNKSTVRRFVGQLWNNANLAIIDELCAPNYEFHDPSLPAWYVLGPNGLKDLATSIHTAFPDFRVTIDDMIAEGDRVVTRVTQTGTQLGSLLDLPPSGRTMSITATSIDRIVEGKLVASWGVSDQLGLWQ